MVSGIHAADWLMAESLVTEGGKPVMAAGGGPDIRLDAVRREQFITADSWSVKGCVAPRATTYTSKQRQAFQIYGRRSGDCDLVVARRRVGGRTQSRRMQCD
jgi:hypothetical protein